ncbi:MAG: ABC transporter permease, partial [Acidimicrobiaceae bacterium]|nr:ABC transporter permease [Acidimicrobiaceae bacterium]
MQIVRTIAVRVAQSLGLLLAVVVLNFTLLKLTPGDPALVIAGESGAADLELLEQIREDYGLNESYLTQLTTYVGNVVQG